MIRLLLSGLAVVAGSHITAAAIKSDESAELFPVLGWRRGAQWEAEIHGWIYEPERRSLALGALRSALGLEDALSPEELALFEERARHFLADNERGKRVSIAVGPKVHRLPASDANGHFHGRIRFDVSSVLPGPFGDANLTVRLAGSESGEPQGEVFLLSQSGLSVISDIDDTIKVTQVRDRRAMLRNTFTRPFVAVTNMAGAYRSWRNRGVQFHYLSSSPWQLYPALSAFMRTNEFPPGSFHLKMFRLKDETAFNLLADPEKHKTGEIESILRRYPGRRFLLVGDSGERDPEIYADAARRFPKQVQGVLIRDVTAEPRGSPRYAAAFEGVDPSRWQLFRDGAELLASPLPGP